MWGKCISLFHYDIFVIKKHTSDLSLGAFTQASVYADPVELGVVWVY